MPSFVGLSSQRETLFLVVSSFSPVLQCLGLAPPAPDESGTSSGPYDVNHYVNRDEAMDVKTLRLSPRATIGKKVKELRRNGIVPVHVYGKSTGSKALQVDVQLLQRTLFEVGTNIPLTVEIEGEEGGSLCFVREVQRHPVTENLLHVDFMSVDVSQVVRAEVPIVILGNSSAVEEMGGTLLQPSQTVLVESLPMNVPESFEVDVSILDDFDKGIFARDLELGEEVTLVTDPGDLLARVSAPRVEVDEDEGVEEAAVEGEEVAEGEAPATAEEGGASGAPEGSPGQR